MDQLLSQLSGGAKCQNANVPLSFEVYGNSPIDKNIQEHVSLLDGVNDYFGSDIGQESMLAQTHPDVVEQFTTEKIRAAHIIALRAYGYNDPAERAQEVEKSMSIAPTCEAYNLKALYQAKSYEEALAFYKKGLELGPSMTKKFNKFTREGVTFGAHSLRGFFRCAHGEANTLRKMGRYQESLESYQRLLKYDSNRYQYSSYVNAKVHVPEVLVHLGKYREALDFIKKDKDLTIMSSSIVTCVWTAALCEFVLKQNGTGNGFPKQLGCDDKHFILQCVFSAPGVLKFLTGDVTLPKIHMPPKFNSGLGVDNTCHCATYATFNKDVWVSVPGALRWAKMCFNTVACYIMLRPAGCSDKSFLKQLRCKDTYQDFERLINDGAYLKGVKTGWHHFVGDAVHHKDPRYLKLLLNKGLSVESEMDSHCWKPIHMACQNGSHPEIVNMLIEKGANVHDTSHCCHSPLIQCVGEGNLDLFEFLLNKVPQLKSSQSLQEACVMAIFESDTVKCLRGKKKCRRCQNEKEDGVFFIKHKYKLDAFDKILRLLLASGYKPSEKFLKTLPKDKHLLDILTGDVQTGASEETNATQDVCHSCDKCGKKAEDIKQCSSCKVAKYCGRDCQVADWGSHKLQCKKITARNL
ncbi:hypothetical protein AKO1_013332 [Acrasis kona]|uniref:MYND-type domain-containing protein n=1 Tax=Acrasis kona TaxID=1008807 RepID=A0AAW2YYT6_9EUKA